jgi:hypothetical protein
MVCNTFASQTKEAVQRLRKYKEVASALQDKLAGNPGVDLRAEIRKDFDISPLRESLNKAGIAFDEDSQRGLDRIIRLIIQDTLELDEAAKLKPGVERTPRRLSTMKAKLTKLVRIYSISPSYNASQSVATGLSAYAAADLLFSRMLHSTRSSSSLVTELP